MTYPLEHLPLNKEDCFRLRGLRIRTTKAFLEKTAHVKGRERIGGLIQASLPRLLLATNAADFLRIKGLGRDYVELLQGAGVPTVKELKHRNPAKLLQVLAEQNQKTAVVSILPSLGKVTSWIEQAKALPILISY